MTPQTKTTTKTKKHKKKKKPNQLQSHPPNLHLHDLRKVLKISNCSVRGNTFLKPKISDSKKCETETTIGSPFCLTVNRLLFP